MGLVDRDDGWRIPDWLWEPMEPLLPPPPPHPLGCHRPRVPNRDAMNAILLVLRTGMQWNALDLTGVCSSSSAHRRFQEWTKAGVFHEFWRQGLLEYDQVVGIDWDWLAADGAMGKAPLGGPKTGPNPTDRAKRGEAVGSRGGGGRPHRARPRWCPPPRPEAPRGDHPLDPGRAPRAERGRSSGTLSRPRLRRARHARARSRARLHAAHPHARRGDQAEGAHPRLAGPPLGRRGRPLLAQPQSRDPHPLV